MLAFGPWTTVKLQLQRKTFWHSSSTVSDVNRQLTIVVFFLFCSCTARHAHKTWTAESALDTSPSRWSRFKKAASTVKHSEINAATVPFAVETFWHHQQSRNTRVLNSPSSEHIIYFTTTSSVMLTNSWNMLYNRSARLCKRGSTQTRVLTYRRELWSLHFLHHLQPLRDIRCVICTRKPIPRLHRFTCIFNALSGALESRTAELPSSCQFKSVHMC